MLNVKRDCIALSIDEIKSRMEYLFGTEPKKDKFTYNEILNFLNDVYFHYDNIVELDKQLKG